MTRDVTSSSDGQEVGTGRLKKAAGSFTGSYKSSDAARVLFQDQNHSNKPALSCQLMKVVKCFTRMHRWRSKGGWTEVAAGYLRCHFISPQSAMTSLLITPPSCRPKDSILVTTSIPSFTFPNTTCLPSSLLREGDLRAGSSSRLKMKKQTNSLPFSLSGADEELGAVGVWP